MTAIRKHLLDFAAVIGLIVIAGGVSLYILSNERLRIPFFQPKPFTINAAFTTAQAVVAGQGQTVRVSGVKIGDIGGVKVANGEAIVKMDLDPQYKDLVHTNATALLRPRTGLKDMFVELQPGSPKAPLVKAGWVMPVQQTAPDVNLDEVLAALDSDTRQYLQLLIHDAAGGLKGRQNDLRDLFRRFEPTERDLSRVNGAVAQRRHNLSHLITALDQLNGELAKHSRQLTQLVGASSQVFRAFASEDQNLSTAVARLPGALTTTTDTLGRVQRLADLLGPTAQHLIPAVTKLPKTNERLTSLATHATPELKNAIRPFVRQARPLVRSLKPATRNTSNAAPSLTQVFTRFNHFLNLATYNPGGRQGPDTPNRQEGFLFWAAWLAHDADSLFALSDANGVFRPITIAAPCAAIAQILKEEPQLEFIESLTPIVTSSAACGGSTGGSNPLPIPTPTVPPLPLAKSPGKAH